MEEQAFQEKLQNQQIANDPNSVYADTMREEKATNILAQIDPGNLLTDIEHRIRGEKKDVYGRWSKVTRSSGEVSEELVSDFISYLGSILNQNTSMSNFKPQEVNNLMELITDWVRTNFMVNAEVYGIEGNYPEYDRIGHIVLNSCFTVFKRALNGSESRKIFRMMKMNETINPSQKSKFTDNFKFW